MMRVVRGMRRVGRVCEMYMCLARCCLGGEGECVDKSIGVGLYQSCGNRKSFGCVFVIGFCGGVCDVGVEWVGGVWEGGV